MNFQPSEEQEMLRQSLATALARHDASKGAEGALVALDIFGLLVPEDLGGSGLGMAEAVIALHEAGKAGAGGELAARLLYAEAVARSLPDQADAVLEGRIRLVSPISGEVSRIGGRITGGLLSAAPESGAEVFLAVPVFGRDEVAFLPADLLSAESSMAISAESGTVRYNVDRAQESVARAVVTGLRERLALLRCAEMLGAADHAFDLSLAYLKDRRQFGQPIGANQALRHIAADCYVQIENARVAIDLAAAMLDSLAEGFDQPAQGQEAAKAVATALAYVPRATREILETAIHLHGGIGLTWDYGLNAPLRRIVQLGMAFGAPTRWRRVLSDLYRAEFEEMRA